MLPNFVNRLFRVAQKLHRKWGVFCSSQNVQCHWGLLMWFEIKLGISNFSIFTTS